MDRLLIKGGRIIDPAQSIDKVANLLVEDGKIVCITDDEPTVDRIIDAGGRMVVPGFIDIHMHEDPYDTKNDCMAQDIAESMALMGVTTCMGGNCGENYYPPDKYLDYMDEHGNCVNMGLYAGHSYIRELCGGLDKYAPVSDEVLDKMVAMAKDYLEKGCMGVSFGVKYIPGTRWEEMTRLSALCQPDGRLVTSHIRKDVTLVCEALKEMADLSVETDTKVQISHIGSMGGYGQMKDVIRDLEAYRAKGIDMYCDCYPYNAFSTNIGATTYDDGFLEEYQADYDAVQMVDGKYAGQRCTKEIFDYERANAPMDLTIGYFMKDEDVTMALNHPYIMVASDGLRSGKQGHPRAAGTFPRFIAEYIKTGKVDLMEGLGKMTSMPAERLNLTKKGNLKPGSDADITIFDYETIKDNATYAEPALVPSGIDYVLIGGSIACDHGKLVNRTLGKAVRYHR